jgi:hypothetical protein
MAVLALAQLSVACPLQATGRLRKNVSYFRVNYMITSVATTSLVLFMNPSSLIVLALLSLVWSYFYLVRTTPVVLGGRELRCASVAACAERVEAGAGRLLKQCMRLC